MVKVDQALKLVVSGLWKANGKRGFSLVNLSRSPDSCDGSRVGEKQTQESSLGATVKVRRSVGTIGQMQLAGIVVLIDRPHPDSLKAHVLSGFCSEPLNWIEEWGAEVVVQNQGTLRVGGDAYKDHQGNYAAHVHDFEGCS
jgi:hypothetical protein